MSWQIRDDTVIIFSLDTTGRSCLSFAVPSVPHSDTEIASTWVVDEFGDPRMLFAWRNCGEHSMRHFSDVGVEVARALLRTQREAKGVPDYVVSLVS